MPTRILSLRALLVPILAAAVLAAPQAALADPDEWGREGHSYSGRHDDDHWRGRDDWRRGFRDDRRDFFERREEWREGRDDWRDRRGEWREGRDEWRDDWRDGRDDRDDWQRRAWRDRSDHHAFGRFGRRDDRHRFGHSFGHGYAQGWPPRRHLDRRGGFPGHGKHGFRGGPPWSR